MDISFKKVSIKEFIHRGMNIIEFETYIREDTELESVYIIGDFILKNYNNRLFSIIAKDSLVFASNLVVQGYPFFSGKIILNKNFEITNREIKKCLFKLKKMDAILMKIFINENFAGVIAWEPFEIDITKLIKQGSNQINCEFISSCRNLLGPHHLKNSDPSFVGPGQFFDIENWDNKYNFVSFGFTTAPEIVIYRQV
jgi:hypothetical protein